MATIWITTEHNLREMGIEAKCFAPLKEKYVIWERYFLKGNKVKYNIGVWVNNNIIKIKKPFKILILNTVMFSWKKQII